jgi:EPS-associated MarR family transcriptional regulator
MRTEENTFKTLRVLERNPRLTQRQLAAELGVSLGKTHYILKSLVDVGLVKLENFQRSNNKLGYAYLLTPKGMAEKAAITIRYLARKQEEYSALKREIEVLRSELDAEGLGSNS